MADSMEYFTKLFIIHKHMFECRGARTDEKSEKVGRIILNHQLSNLCPYYTMHWVCVLVSFVSTNVSKTCAEREKNARKMLLAHT